jgi:hypothetical protein
MASGEQKKTHPGDFNFTSATVLPPPHRRRRRCCAHAAVLLLPLLLLAMTPDAVFKICATPRYIVLPDRSNRPVVRTTS